MQRKPRVSPRSADRVGTLARQILAANASGTILASHSRAAYLLSAVGELTWLAPGDVPMHRRGVRLAGLVPRAAVGSTYRVVDSRLLLGSVAAIDLSRALAWEPERWPRPLRPMEPPPERNPGSTSGLLCSLPAPRGFGILLPAIIEYADGGALPSGAPQSTPLLARAAPSVFGIARACREQDGAALLEEAARLVGLGEGLTPSGDDLVGGVLFGLAMLGDAGVQVPACSPRALMAVLEASRPHTNRISFALLGDHAAGHACEPAHRLVLALLGKRAPDASQGAAADLIRVGHSTGWDLLTGVWTALALVPRHGSPIRRGVSVPTLAAAP
jgi:hypothetical protein